MPVEEDTWKIEQQRVQRVIGQMQRQIDKLESAIGLVKTDVVHIRKHFWDEVTVNLGSTDDIVETHLAVKQQADVLADRERHYSQNAAALRKLNRLVDSPYFGRIDFTDDERSETEQIYLGIGSFANDTDDNFLVYDWRAPISSLYYDCAPGEVTYQAPMGNIDGIMSLKRQYIIRDGQLQYMFDAGLTIGDELLIRVLSRHSDAQMKSIVATIQREQNRIIRNDKSRMLIVQGAAGSGKTSAALQRVAYLLYKYRKTLDANQMVLFSPNPLFSSYVSTVLPELGEENMQQATFQEYLEHRLGEDYQIEDMFSQIEYVLADENSPGYSARMSAIRYKSSVAYLEVIHNYRILLEKSSMLFKPVTFNHQVIVTAEEIQEKFYEYGDSFRLPNRIDSLCRWILQEITVFVESESQADWVRDEVDMLDPDDYQRAYQQLRQNQKGQDFTFNDIDQEHELLSKMMVRDHLKPLRRWVKQRQFIDVTGLYRQLFSNHSIFKQVSGGLNTLSDWKEICKMTTTQIDEFHLYYEDATPFLYLKELVQGSRVNTSVRHVLVDEAQDYSPFQFEFLKRLFPRCRMTVLGDLNQAIHAQESVLDDFRIISKLYGKEETEIIELTRSYRSTREIVEFTRGIVRGGEKIVPFNRAGEKPSVTVVNTDESLLDHVVSQVQTLKSEGYTSIAIICKTAVECARVHASLHPRVSLIQITMQTPTFTKDTLVLPAYLAKGVEFDAVILYNASSQQYYRETERKLFYTACTRAMHALHIYSCGEVSPFISSLHPDTYILTS